MKRSGNVGLMLMGGAGLLGLLLAAIGLYGVLAFSVSRRTREIGVRIAIGATGREISRMVLVESAKLLAIGSAAGIAVALLVTKPLAIFFVDGLTSSDPASYIAVILVLGVSGVLATLGPVRRAVKIDPMRALRCE